MRVPVVPFLSTNCHNSAIEIPSEYGAAAARGLNWFNSHPSVLLKHPHYLYESLISFASNFHLVLNSTFLGILLPLVLHHCKKSTASNSW